MHTPVYYQALKITIIYNRFSDVSQTMSHTAITLDVARNAAWNNAECQRHPATKIYIMKCDATDSD